jgi:hypothetical protein
MSLTVLTNFLIFYFLIDGYFDWYKRLPHIENPFSSGSWKDITAGLPAACRAEGKVLLCYEAFPPLL